jgi:hypothetical protein
MTPPPSRTARTAGWLLGAGTAAALAATAVAADPVTQARKTREDVIQANIKAPQDKQPSHEELQRSIERLQNMRPAPKPAPVEAPLPPELTETVLSAGNPFSLATPTTKPAAPTIPDSVIADLKRMPTEQIADMAALADALYLGNRQEEAFLFYEKALASSPAPETKAWALFQMANCRRQTNLAAALTLYKRLTTEYPKCPWASVAQTQQQVLAWYQTSGLVTTSAPAAATAPAASSATEPAKEKTPVADNEKAAPPAAAAAPKAATPTSPDKKPNGS